MGLPRDPYTSWWPSVLAYAATAAIVIWWALQ